MNKVIVGIVGLMMVMSVLVYDSLPERVPMHWNIEGQVDNFMSKQMAIWFFPGIGLAMLFLFRVLPYLDPKKDAYKLFKKDWELMQAGFLGFFAYMQALVFVIAFNPQVSLLPWFFVGLGGLFILLGKTIKNIRPNYFPRIRTPWSLANDENWKKTHIYSSKIFTLAGVVFLIGGFLNWYLPLVIFSVILLTALLPFIYSFLVFKKAEDKMKYVYVVALLLVIAAGLRFGGNEDGWLCDNGEWVRHGNSSASMPKQPCN